MKGKPAGKPALPPRKPVARSIPWRLLCLFIVVAPISYEFRSGSGVKDGIATGVLVSAAVHIVASRRRLVGSMNLALVYGTGAGLLAGIFGNAALFFFAAATITQAFREGAGALAAGVAWGLAKGVFSDDPKIPRRLEWTKDAWAAVFAIPIIGATFAAGSFWRGASLWVGLMAGALVAGAFEGGLFFGRWLAVQLGPSGLTRSDPVACS
jgi:hypothetical protein